MKLRSIIYVLAGILLAGGAWVLHVTYLNQTITLAVLGFKAEPPLSLAILALVILSIVLLLGWKLLSLILFFPYHLNRWHRSIREKRRVRLISDGLQSMVLGVTSSQHKSLKAAGDAGVAPASSYYLAAAATSDEKTQVSLLRKAAKADGDPMVQAMATARMRLHENLPAEACEVLRAAGAATHKANQPLRLLLEALERSGDSRGALDVAQTLLARDPSPSLSNLVSKLTSDLLKDAGNPDDVRGLLGSVSKGNGSGAFALAAAKQLAAVNDIEGATAVLMQAWKQNKEPQILEAIAKHGSQDAVKKLLGQTDSLLGKKPADPDLMCAFAELAMREKIFGQARKLLNEALELSPKRSIYLSLARLADLEGKSSEETNRLYKLAAQNSD